jgi:hypothetical protein
VSFATSFGCFALRAEQGSCLQPARPR